MDEEKVLHYYLNESERTRNQYGLTRIKNPSKGTYDLWICNLEALQALKEPIKTYVRNWVNEQKKKGLYKGVFPKED